jgi:1,4-dihydroxy-2-naphthoyl-CoA hydrolase
MFKTEKKINFYDCDPAGILFYGRIFELCHSAYEGMIAGFNLDEDYWKNDEYIVPIIHSEAFYHKPVKYGDIISIEIVVKLLRSSSFELNYSCRNKNGEECHAVRTVHVFVDKKTWKKSAMKPKLSAGLSSHLSQ